MHFFGWLGFSNFHVRQTFVKQPFESKRAVASCKTPGSNAENRIQRCKGTPESLNLMILMVTMVTMFFFFFFGQLYLDGFLLPCDEVDPGYYAGILLCGVFGGLWCFCRRKKTATKILVWLNWGLKLCQFLETGDWRLSMTTWLLVFFFGYP